MKKILIAVLIVLLSLLAYQTVARGILIGSMQIFSINSIKDANSNLDNKISEASKLTSVTYPERISNLNSSAKDLLKKKSNYDELVELSYQSDLAITQTREVYEIELLWLKIGTYATKQGVKVKLDVVQSVNQVANTKDLKFTVTGNYIPITDFIYNIENDSKLNFKIESFSMVMAEDNKNLQATFTVKEVSLNQNTTNASSQVNTNTTTTKSNTAENTSATNTTTSNSSNTKNK